ncbi:MAG TPA: DUF4349 domain-containing protein [Micromonosporaceae bacterium]|jgi:hypothetical protein
MNEATRGWRTAAVLTVAGLVAVLALGACGGPDRSSPASNSGGANAGGAAGNAEGAPAQPPPDKAAQPGQAPGGAPIQFRVDDRAIVYTGGMTVRVADVDRAAARVTEIATGAGGFVGQDKRSMADSHAEATLQLRVPAARFQGVVSELADLGKEDSRELSSEDVTEAVVDVDSRIASQQASVSRTRSLLAQAKTIAEIVSVEGELTKREADLASLQARKRQLSSLTTLSTITVTLLGPQAKAARSTDRGTGFLTGLRAGWHAFVASIQVLLTVLGALLPWLVVLGVPISAVLWLARRYGRRTPPRPMGPPASVTVPTGPPTYPVPPAEKPEP